MKNVSNRLQSLTANDGHAVISVQTTGARMRDVCACRRHQRPPRLPGSVIRGGGLLHSSQLDAGSSRRDSVSMLRLLTDGGTAQSIIITAA